MKLTTNVGDFNYRYIYNAKCGYMLMDSVCGEDAKALGMWRGSGLFMWLCREHLNGEIVSHFEKQLRDKSENT